ncbi:MAG TPA: PilZ domain-containing protein [Deltaproteobacteria bacterium]|nr:PilZ domain-containing protein [Deltaproteobacteria bacterium]
MHKDRRRFSRTDLPIRVHIYSGRRWTTATAMDISKDGIRIRLEDEVALSKRLGLRLGNQSETFGVKVCWSHGLEIGCAFLDSLDERRYTKLLMKTFTA